MDSDVWRVNDHTVCQNSVSNVVVPHSIFFCVCEEAFATEAKGHKHIHPCTLPFIEHRHRVLDTSIARDIQNFFPQKLISDSQVQRV